MSSVFVAVLTILSGCGDAVGPNGGAYRLYIGQAPPFLDIGDSAELSAHAISDASGLDVPVELTWTSSDTAILAVSEDGVISARGAGTAWIHVRGGEEQDSLPIRVLDAPKVTSLAIGLDYACAIGDGTYCWGSNSFGELGIGNGDDACSWKSASCGPTQIGRDLVFKNISATLFRTCALDEEGLTYCWGQAREDEAADWCKFNYSARPCNRKPVQMAGVPAFAQIVVGVQHTCGRTASGLIYCWGDNSQAQLGNGDIELGYFPPEPVEGISSATSIVTGELHNCALVVSGETLCWGRNFGGEIGNGMLDDAKLPIAPSGNHRFVTLAAGFTDTCGITTDGSLYCWGDGAGGELGPGVPRDCRDGEGVAFECSRVPRRIEGLPPVERVAAGLGLTCAISRNRQLYCWGNSIMESEPTLISSDLKFVQIAAGAGTACGITTRNRVYCLGDDLHGFPHRPAGVESSIPIRVPLSSN